jgi:phasin
MAENKNQHGKPLGSEGYRSDRPSTEAAGAVRQVANQGASLANELSEKTTATAEHATKVLEQTYSTVAKSAADFNRQWLEMIRANTNSALDFVHRLVGVKSPTEFFELSSVHCRKQFETFAEQSQQLAGLAQKATTDAIAPVQAGMKSALTKAA